MTRTRTFLPIALALACALPGPWLASAAAQAPGASQGSAGARVRCNTDQRRVEQVRASRSFVEAFSAAFSSHNCASVQSVLSRLMSAEVTGGRKLKSAAALDPVAAAKERSAAHADAEFSRELAQALAGEAHPLRRKLIEAAQLDAFGHYAARDLLIEELRAETGGPP